MNADRYPRRHLRLSLCLCLWVLLGTGFTCERGGVSEQPAESSTEGRLPKGTLRFEDGPTIDIEIAAAIEARRIGLSYRKGLCDLCGLYFVFPERAPQTFWMRRMRFPIDILWIDEGRVVGVSADVQPPADPDAPEETLPRYESPVPVRLVLEVPAGFAEKHGIGPGTALSVKAE